MRRPTKAGIVKVVQRVRFFIGPVAGAVHGELSKPEQKRVAAKFLILLAVGGTSMKAAVKDPDFQSNVLAPVAIAAVGAGWEAMSRKEQGERKPPDEPKPKDAT